MESVLTHLRSTRELRAEMLWLAARLPDDGSPAVLRLLAPRILESTLREEWRLHLEALKPDRAARLQLRIEYAEATNDPRTPGKDAEDRPNDRHAVLRLLLADALDARRASKASAHRRTTLTQAGLAETLGLSLTPIRSALRVLADVGLIPSMRRPRLQPESVSLEALGRINALPRVLRYRFGRGAQLRSPATLLQRTVELLADRRDEPWRGLALSGTVVALAQVPTLDLLGVPRLDLLLQGLPDQRLPLDRLIRTLDDGLELEPNVLAPAPVTLTVARCTLPLDRVQIGDEAPIRCAHPADVFLALLDLDRRDLALDYLSGLQA